MTTLRYEGRRLQLAITLSALVLIASISSGLGAKGALADATHVTYGQGPHNSGSHGNNPGHIWVGVQSPNSASVSSGGQYHDGCYYYPNIDQHCYPAFWGDWALDIDAGGGSTSYLTLYYAGSAADSYSTAPPNNNQPIWITAYVSGSGGSGTCAWQRFDVRVSYTDVYGTFRSNLTIGQVWLEHQTNWAYSSGQTINPNVQSSNPWGSGIAYWISQLAVSQVYNGSGSCSTGPHTHIELFSNHNYGQALEWHSGGGPDGYTSPTIHAHYYSFGYNAPTGNDPVGTGNVLGWLGGWSMSFFMQDNPYRSGH